jgi:hypothetical protein
MCWIGKGSVAVLIVVSVFVSVKKLLGQKKNRRPCGLRLGDWLGSLWWIREAHNAAGPLGDTSSNS